MNDAIIQEGAEILFRRFQLAIALYVIEQCPVNKNIKDFAEEFQLDFRNRSKRCKLLLERKIFCERLSHLFSINLHDLNLNTKFPEPMEIDVLPPTCDYNHHLELHYIEFCKKLSVATELLEVIYETEILLNKTNYISSKDVLRILSKFGHLKINQHSIDLYSNGTVTQVSQNAFHHLIDVFDFKKIAKECIVSIVKYFKSYLYELPRNPSHSQKEALIWMTKANRILMKCFDDYVCEGQYQGIILSLLRESIEKVLRIERTFDLHFQVYCSSIIRQWKNHKLLCINCLNIFISFVDTTYGSKNEEVKVCERILQLTRSFLITYCKKHLNKCNSTVSPSKRIQLENNSKFDKRNLWYWGKAIAAINHEEKESNLSCISKLAWDCLKIILSTGEMRSFTEKHGSK